MIRASLALPSRSARWTCAARYQPAGTASATVKAAVWKVLQNASISVTPPASPAKARRHPSKLIVHPSGVRMRTEPTPISTRGSTAKAAALAQTVQRSHASPQRPEAKPDRTASLGAASKAKA